MDILNDFLLQVNQASRLRPQQQAGKINSLLRLHPSLNPVIVKLNNLGDLDEAQIEDAVQQRNFYNDDWIAFNSVIVSFVRLSNQLNPYSVLESYDLYATFLNDLSVAFTNKNRGYLLSPLIQDTIAFVVPLATQLDMQLLYKENQRRPRLTHIAALLLKIFNNIRSQLGAGDHIEAAKKSIMLFIGTRLCLTYFRLSNPLLCRNVFSNMNNANLQLGSYPMNQQIQYRYYLAKFYMVKYQFVDAYQHFHWCLTHCPSNYCQDNDNITRILRDIIPVGIILGKTPNIDNICRMFYSSPAKCPPFLALYSQLMESIKQGNFYQFHQLINNPTHYDFLKQHKIILFLSAKSCVVILRNLIKRSWILQGKQARLDYDTIRIALEVSLSGLLLHSVNKLGPTTQPEIIDDFVVENCLITLIDQNLLKGKLFPRLRVVSLSKTNVFPAVDSINFVKFGNGPEGTPNYADKWMN